MRLIDLSLDFYAGMPKPGAHPPVELRYLLTPSAEEEAHRGFTNKMEQFAATTHVGTHIDAPSHFTIGGKNIDDYPPEWFFLVPTVLLRIPKPEYGGISAADLDAAQEQCGVQIRPGGLVLLDTGSAARYGTESYLHSPYLTEEAARYLADRAPRMVGIDSFTVDDPRRKEKPAHVVLLKEHEILIIEGLTNLDKLPAHRFESVCLPLRIRGGSGGYTRMAAVLRDEEGNQNESIHPYQ